MSVYSRWVDARGTISIVSRRAARQASKPVFCSRRGSGPSVGGPGWGAIDEPWLIQYGWTLKPYSDCTASAGTAGLISAGPGKPLWPLESLSSATTVSTRLSTPCTYETAAAPSECPMIATRLVRPRVFVRPSRERSNLRQSGLNEFTGTLPPEGFGYGRRGVERKKSSASSVPKTKFESCCAGTPGQPNDSPSRAGASGLQNGSAFTCSFSCGSVSLVPWPCTSYVSTT